MLPIPQYHRTHITHTGAVHEYLTGGDSAVCLAGLSGELQHFRDADILGV